MTEVNAAQIHEIRTKVLGAAAKVPGALIGLGILFILLGITGIAGHNLFLFVSINALGIFLFAGGYSINKASNLQGNQRRKYFLCQWKKQTFIRISP